MDTQKLREEATDKVAEALGDAYDCTRTWQAWSYGTMGPDDFALVADDDSRLSEITEAALAPALAAIDAQAAEIARLRGACEKAIEWLEGWASAEPYLSELRAALAQEQA